MTGPLGYLSRLCRRWSGELVLMSEPEFRALPFNAPWVDDGITRGPDDNHATDRPRRKVIAVDGMANPGAIVHEMGHCFLSEGNPSNDGEFDWLGWEIVLARRARCYRIWSAQNAEYLINTNLGERTWGTLTADRRRCLITDRIDWAMSLGIVSQDGEPLCTRRP